MSDSTAPKYFVVQTIWYEPEKREALPGERLDLSHLSEEHLAKWLAMNVVMPDEVGKVAFQKNLSTPPRKPVQPVEPASKEK